MECKEVWSERGLICPSGPSGFNVLVVCVCTVTAGSDWILVSSSLVQNRRYSVVQTWRRPKRVKLDIWSGPAKISATSRPKSVTSHSRFTLSVRLKWCFRKVAFRANFLIDIYSASIFKNGFCASVQL